MPTDTPRAGETWCEWCERAYGTGLPTHMAGDPRCAFPGGEFDPHNWNCAGLHAMRRHAEEVEVWNEDQKAALLRLGECRYVLLSYYKRRGQTEGAWVVEGETIRPLSASDVREFIEFRRVIPSDGRET